MSSDHVAQRLADIFYNIERIENHIRGTTKTKFLDDELLNDGVERCLERIAKAARKIGDHFDDQYYSLIACNIMAIECAVNRWLGITKSRAYLGHHLSLLGIPQRVFCNQGIFVRPTHGIHS
jgi:hypothetical protein